MLEDLKSNDGEDSVKTVDQAVALLGEVQDWLIKELARPQYYRKQLAEAITDIEKAIDLTIDYGEKMGEWQ
nr:MAG TPA: hypothetical protein [Caudoviricetes sp.]